MFTLINKVTKHLNTEIKSSSLLFSGLRVPPLLGKLSSFLLLDINTLNFYPFCVTLTLLIKFLLIPSTWLLALFVALVSCRCRRSSSRFGPHCTKIQYIITLEFITAQQMHACILYIH